MADGPTRPLTALLQKEAQGTRPDLSAKLQVIGLLQGHGLLLEQAQLKVGEILDVNYYQKFELLLDEKLAGV